MADDDIKIKIPPPDTKKARSEVERFIDKLEKLEKQIQRTDKISKKASFGKKRGGGPILGSGPSGKNPGKGFLGGGTSGGVANIARAGGIGGPAAVALGQAAPMASILIGLVAGFKDAITKAAEFQTALTEIGRVSGLAGEDLKTFGDNVAQLSTEIPVATKQIFQLASAGANAGLNAGQLKAFTYQMSQLAVILPSLSDEQVRGIIRIASLTDFPIDRIEDLNGALLNLQQRTKATLPQLIQLGQRVAQDVGIFGASTKEVAGLTAVIADLGLPPERASTSIGRLTGKIKNLSALGPKAIKRITDTFRDQEKAVGFVTLAMEKPIEAMQLLAQQSTDARTALDTIGISSGSKAGNILLNLLGRGERWLEIQKEAKLNGGLVDDQAALVMKDLNSQWILFKNTLDDLSRSFGTKILPYVTDFLKLFRSAIAGAERMGDVLHAIEPPPWLADVVKYTSPLGAAMETMKTAFSAAGEIADGHLFEAEVERSNKIIKIMNTLGERIKDLRRQGKNLILLDPHENEKAIRDLDKEIVFLQGTVNTMLEGLGATGKETADVMKQIRTIISEFNIGPIITKGAEAMKELAAGATKAQEAIARIFKKSDDIAFDIKIFDLSKNRQDMERLMRATDETFSKSLGGDILNKDQVDRMREQVNDLTKKLSAGGIEIALRDGDGKLFSAKTLAKKIKELRKGPAFGPEGEFGGGKSQDVQSEKLLNVLQRLATSLGVSEALKHKEGLSFDLLQKTIAKEQEAELKRIAGTKAPGLNLIDSVGKGVEVLNQQILDTDVQKDMLNALEIQNDLTEEMIRSLKNSFNNRNPVSTYAGSQ